MKKVVVLGLLLGIFAACNKYPDGPKFSLLTKRSRLAGVWDLQETVYQSGQVYTDQNDYLTTIKKNKTMTIENGSGSFSGTWAFFSDDEEVRFAFNGIYEQYKIRRLAKKELWLQDVSNGDILKFKNLDN